MTRLIILVFLIGSLNASATHLFGGEISFDCLGSGQYEFTLTLYHHCSSGVALPPTEQIGGPQGSINLNLISTEGFLPVCFDTSVTGCGPNSVWQIERSTYKGVTTLTGPIPASGWEFGWSHCCRSNAAIRNLYGTSSGIYLKANMYPDPSGSCSASASWQDVVPAIDTGLFQFRNDALPPLVNDSLHFRLVTPMVSAGSIAAFIPGYSASAPFPDSDEDPANGAVILIPATGSIITDIKTPFSTPKMFSYAMEVENWRGGNLIGTSYRDLPILLEPDLFVRGNQQNNLPVAVIDTALWNYQSWPGQPVITPDGILHATVSFGDTMYFEMSAQDFDYNTTSGGGLIPQNIIFSASGIALDTSRTNFRNYPTLTPKAPQSSFSQALNNNILFSWIIDSTHLTGASTSYMFQFEFRDDNCPIPGAAVIDVEVVVTPGSNQIGKLEEELRDIQLFPNPAHDRVRIKGVDEGVEVLIFDLTGALLKHEVLESSGELDIRTLQSGVYLIEIESQVIRMLVE